MLTICIEIILLSSIIQFPETNVVAPFVQLDTVTATVYGQQHLYVKTTRHLFQASLFLYHVHPRDMLTGKNIKISSGCRLQTDYKRLQITTEMKDKTTSLLTWDSSIISKKKVNTTVSLQFFLSVLSDLAEKADLQYSHLTSSHERNGNSFPN